jgi:acetolactate synthase I/II/III large subunit
MKTKLETYVAHMENDPISRSLAQAEVWENSDLILEHLDELGVEYLFGVPGGAIGPLYNALARKAQQAGEKTIRPIIARHETGASFMADGYTRESGNLGVCCGTSGPGATNLITGVASAYENEIPQLVITAQTALCTFGKGASQESSCTSVNTVAMFQQCTRYNSLVSHTAQLEHKLVAAIMTAFRPPRGPVHLSIPIDVLSAPASAKAFSINKGMLDEAFPPRLPNESVLDELIRQIREAKKFVIVVGAGCSGATHAVSRLAKLLKADIVTSIDGKGLISSYHGRYRGVFGFAGHASARDALRDPDVDLVLALGTNLCELSSGGWDEQSLLNDRLIHIDSVESHFVRSTMGSLQVFGAIGEICHYLIDQLPSRNWRGNESYLPNTEEPGCRLQSIHKYEDNSTPIKPQRLMKELGERFPPETRFLADIGNSFAWATHYLHPKDRRGDPKESDKEIVDFDRRRSARGKLDTAIYRAGIEFAAMGWAIGSAVGTALANRLYPVVCITGDGSFLMNGQEITVALSEGLTIIFVILNDSSLGMVKHGQRLSGDERIGYELPKVDFALLARSMGVNAYTIRSPDDFDALNIAEICAYKGPTLLDIYIDPDEVPPMGLRVELLEAARHRNA